MAYNFTELTTEVRTELAKTSDSALITAARCGIWVNQAQRRIVRAVPGLRDVDTLDKTTWKTQQNVYEYELGDFVVKPVAHIIGIKYIDVANSNYRVIRPYPGGLDKWNYDYPYIPDRGTGEPEYYVQRGNTVELCYMPGSDQDNKPLWLHYSYLPDDLTGTETPVLTDMDDALIHMAKSLAFRAMGDKEQQANEAERYALSLVGDRVLGEEDFDDADQIPYYGP